jgi:hypothetical protein
MNHPRSQIKFSHLDPSIMEVIKFINFAVELENTNLYKYYGLMKTKTHIILQCMLPKVAFDSLNKEKPYKYIFTSATLPK